MKHGIAVVQVAVFLAASGAQAQQATWQDAFDAHISERYAAPEYRAFDFWIGEWHMKWRQRPEGEFYHSQDGDYTHQRVFPILGGKALVELAWDRDKPDEPSQRGFSIRYFDPARECWIMAQNWPSGNNNGMAFMDQLIGHEHLGRLSMYSVSYWRGADGQFVPQHRRYNFTDIRPGVSFRWDGSNTPDEGANWFTWSIVDAVRQRDLDAWRTAGTALPGYHTGALCTAAPHGAFDGLQGVWEGTVSFGDGARPARFSAGELLDGCAVAGVLETDGVKTFMTFGYHERHGKWLSFRLDDRPGTPHRYFAADTAGDGATFTAVPLLAIVDEFTDFYGGDKLDTASALARTVWTAITADQIAFHDDERESVDAPWRTVRSYRLSRR